MAIVTSVKHLRADLSMSTFLFAVVPPPRRRRQGAERQALFVNPAKAASTRSIGQAVKSRPNPDSHPLRHSARLGDLTGSEILWHHRGMKLPVSSRATIWRITAPAMALSAILGVVFMCFSATMPTAAVAREFRAADNQTEDYPTVQALRFMGRLIAEKSGGRDQIQVFHSRQLGEEKETIEQTRVGAIDLNRSNVALIGSFVPAMNVLAMPFLFRSTEHLHKVLDGPIGNEILNSFEPYGFVGLTFYDSGARSIYNSVRPIRSLVDMKGLRIRVQQSSLMFDVIKALGAEPVELPYGQVLTGLATKLIDGAENNWPSYVTTDHYKYAGYYTLTEHTVSPEVLVMSLKAWQSLSDDERKIFRDAALQSNLFMRKEWKDLEDRSRRQAKAANVTIVTDFDRKPFEAAVAGLYAKAQHDPATAELIERIRNVE
jgi:tripartite ATP-independent transporter DctP family solute receptor